jgi:hypothetical protein
VAYLTENCCGVAVCAPVCNPASAFVQVEEPDAASSAGGRS